MNLPRPTDAELAVLNVLWDRGPSTVRQIHDVLSGTRDLGYTTVLKSLQVMTEKGLVLRNESERSHVFAATLSETQTQRSLLGDLMERAFGGSAAKLVIQALQAKRASKQELDEIRKLLDEGGES
ncbi:MAG: BlaI/MecI/CopY family transcriptional regulator [Holophaga sp.]|nr:BlaI/MecI/CopY family transcriptional regulator [Holophaga sp.]